MTCVTLGLGELNQVLKQLCVFVFRTWFDSPALHPRDRCTMVMTMMMM